MVFFIPTSIAAIVTTIKNKLINWKVGIPVSIAGIFGAIVGASISVKMNVNVLRKYFGIFLGLIAIYEIYSILKKYIFNKKKTY